MNEAGLRQAFRALVAKPASPTGRVTRISGSSVVVAVTVVAVGFSGLLSACGAPDRSVSLGGSPQLTPTATAVPDPELTGTATEPVWPTGADGQPQTDRTATAGPRYDQGHRLMEQLLAVVPAGFTVPQDAPDPRATGPQAGDPWVRYHQAQFADRVDGVEVWEYLASLEVIQGQRAGWLFVQVHTPGNTLPADLCPLARELGGLGGECQVKDVGGKQVGVVTSPTGDRQEFDQWAAYRHPDGTVVYMAQADTFRSSSPDPATPQRPGLAAQPLSVQQLAELATDERFHLS